MKKTKIGIIGFGIVGQAVSHGFSDTSLYQTLYYDKYKDSQPLEEVITQSDFIFICLPTPMKANETGIDLSIIEETIKQITALTNRTGKIIIIKSTVVPGTTRDFQKKYPKSNFVFNPEFLTEANYLEDFLNADRTIIGATNDQISLAVVELYRQLFPETKIFQTDPTTAEMVKYMANTYLATKVIFANQMYDLCTNLGIKYEEVKKMVVADRRIEDDHLDVTTMRGFGSKCFPKDIIAIIGKTKEVGLRVELLETVWKINKKIRKVHDWEDIPFVISKEEI